MLRRSMARLAVGRVRSVAKRVVRGATGERDGVTPTPFSIELEYEVQPEFRHGYGLPAHPEIDALLRQGHERYRTLLEGFTELADRLAAIPMQRTGPSEPFWENGWFQGVDFVALYGLVSQRSPARIVEVGSGNSTRLVRRAIDDHLLQVHHVAIDPSPRRPVTDLVDEYIQQPLEATDLSRFDELEAGDILFFDGSHRSFTNTDVTVMFNEVLPRLAPGVLVHVHDIFLPWDYPPHWADRWYSEQYLLASWLLAGQRLNVVLPAMYVCINADLHHTLDPIFDRLAWAGVTTNGSSFWFEMQGAQT
jgi:hypothetical protein